MAQRTGLLINSHSRQAAEQVALAKSLLEENGISVDREWIVPEPAKLIEQLEAAIAEEFDRLIIGGGDGTLAASVDKLVGTDTVLGVLPLGTTNNFARSLELPLDLEGAVGVIARGESKRINLGCVNDRHYVNLAAIGISAKVAHNVSDRFKKYLGRLAYPLSGIKWLFTHKHFQAVIQLENEAHTINTHQLIIANGRYHGALPVTPDAGLHDDTLSIIAVGTEKSRWQHFKNLVRFATSNPYESPTALILKAEKVSITTTPAKPVETDGEITTRTPAEFSVVKDALSVLVP